MKLIFHFLLKYAISLFHSLILLPAETLQYLEVLFSFCIRTDAITQRLLNNLQRSILLLEH